jgi:hypothetical protein
MNHSSSKRTRMSSCGKASLKNLKSRIALLGFEFICSRFDAIFMCKSDLVWMENESNCGNADGVEIFTLKTQHISAWACSTLSLYFDTNTCFLTQNSNIFHILIYLCIHFMFWNKINKITYYKHGKAYTLVLISNSKNKTPILWNEKTLHPYPYCDVLFPIPFNYRTMKAGSAENNSPKKCQKIK